MYRLNDETGASTIVVAIAAVAIFGMAAYALDTAAIYEEKRELQNGADASALAIAEDCLLDPASCTYAGANASATLYADANADDGTSLVDQLTLDAVGQSVTVELRTRDAEGGNVVAPFFGKVLGFDGASVAAEASAIWGYADELTTLPLIISECEWLDPNRPPLQEGPPFNVDPWLFVFHQGNHGRTCDHSNSGFDLPGGFGWLDADAGPCRTVFNTGEWKEGLDPGSAPTTSCTPSFLHDTLMGKPVYLPYYEDKELQGNNGRYLVSGIGAFWVTGYNFGGQFKEPSNNPPCTGSVRCIEGYLIKATTSQGEIGGPNRGASIVRLTS